MHEVSTACVGTTEEKKIDMIDNFLDLGRNLIPDNLFRAAFQTVSLFKITKSDTKAGSPVCPI